MQLNWLYFCGICQMMPLKVWPNTALGCNHQSICMPQLQPWCSAALVPNVDDGDGVGTNVMRTGLGWGQTWWGRGEDGDKSDGDGVGMGKPSVPVSLSNAEPNYPSGINRANALECWRSPSLRLIIPGIAVPPGVRVGPHVASVRQDSLRHERMCSCLSEART